MLLINFKTYSQSTGENAIKLAKIVEKVKKKTGKDIFIVPNLVDMKDVSKITEVFSQHIDPVEPGAQTGHITYEMIGFCKGVVINHSEDRMKIEDIEKSIAIAKKVGLKTVVCAHDDKFAAKVAEFKPDYVAVEPPELIGGDISISKAKPGIIKKSVAAVGRKSKLLVGAGVKTREDVAKAVELGASGVFVASGIVKADDPEAVIREMIGPL
jgi:triosephosphate isomerase